MKQIDWSAHYPVPSYLHKIALFDDLASGKIMLLAKWAGDPWLFYWHKHGENWVSLRQPSPADLAAIQAEVDSGRSTHVGDKP